MDHGPLSKETIDRVENIHINHGIYLVRHREWATGEYVERLCRVVDNLPVPTRNKIFVLLDRKGILKVTWKEHPFDVDLQSIASAWIDEHEDNDTIEHSMTYAI